MLRTPALPCSLWPPPVNSEDPGAGGVISPVSRQGGVLLMFPAHGPPIHFWPQSPCRISRSRATTDVLKPKPSWQTLCSSGTHMRVRIAWQWPQTCQVASRETLSRHWEHRPQGGGGRPRLQLALAGFLCDHGEGFSLPSLSFPICKAGGKGGDWERPPASCLDQWAWLQWP